MSAVVSGVIFDESVLFVQPQSSSLHPALDFLFRLLCHSKIHTKLAFESGISLEKEKLLKDFATKHSCECFTWNASSVDDTIRSIMLAWCGGTYGRILFVTSSDKKNLHLEQAKCSWLVVDPNAEAGDAGENSSMLYIKKLEELPLMICRLNKEATGGTAVTVGYIMKPSRIEDFAKRGAFPLFPSEKGLIFMPLMFDLPISSQLQEVDVVLHKGTDDIISIDLGISSECSHRITYTNGMQELQRYLEDHPDLCAIDPVRNIYPVLDRLEIQRILLGLQDFKKGSKCHIRGPHFLKVDNFEVPDLVGKLSEAKLSLPSIVKPQVACGVPDAHHMAVVFTVEQFKDLSVPLPAIVQEYVDHSSILYKFYVLGEKVFYAVKKSTPNAKALMELSENNGLKPLVFDSLRSLPTARNNQQADDESHHMDLGLVTDAANWLRRTLDLTIFGFDVVIEESTGDHVIVDVNYLPSFKEVPDDIAVPAFWDAIKTKYESARSKK